MQPLGLGGNMLINGQILKRDGFFYVPEKQNEKKLLPLLVWLHGGGGDAESHKYLSNVAEEFDVVLLAIDSRHNTWDGIDNMIGPDVIFIEKAMQYVIERVPVDPKKVALAGLSDGASYALAIGRANGDLFTHLIGVAPWFLSPPSAPIGQPKILIAHGARDNVYPASVSRLILVPRLEASEYDVNYLEFDGPHWLPETVARKVFRWFLEN